MSEPGRRSPLDPRKELISVWFAKGEAVIRSRVNQWQNTYKIRRDMIERSLSQLDRENAVAGEVFRTQLASLNEARKAKLDEIDAEYKRQKGANVFWRMPAEILGYIFEQCVEGDLPIVGGAGLGASPWILALVCRFWYRTALGTPSLWAKILVTNTLEQYWAIKRHQGVRHTMGPDAVRTHSAMQVCVNKNELANALRRSGAAPLEITLDFQDIPPIIPAYSGPSFFEELYRMVFNDEVGPRISQITAGVSGHNWGLLRSRLVLISGASGELSNLTVLKIHSLAPFSMRVQGDRPMLEAILGSAKRLQEIHLGITGIPECLQHEHWRTSTYSSTISNLTELRVQDANALDDLIGGILNVRTVVIDGPSRVEKADAEGIWDIETSPWPTLVTTETTFQRLSRLHVICDDFSFLSRLKFPALQELRLTQSSSSRKASLTTEATNSLNQPNFILDLPSLRTLQAVSHRFAPFNRFNMPLLETLHLTSTQGLQAKASSDFEALIGSLNPTDANTTIPSFFESVRNLYIHASMSEKAFVQTLKAFPLLQSVTIVPGRKIGKQIIQELTVGKFNHREKGALCPALKTLELDCYSFREWNRKLRKEVRIGTMGVDIALVKKLAVSRRNWWEPLERCTLVDEQGVKQELAPRLNSRIID